VAVGVLLTGIGRAGALRLKALRAKGHHTIAQEQATSPVYGMPKAAAALDAAVDILPLENIAAKLMHKVGSSKMLMAEMDTDRTSARERPVPPAGGYTVNVLLVDDQPMIGEDVRRLLNGQPDIHFHFCSTSAEAVETAEKVRPTVILQDLVMPGTDGLTLVRQYRAYRATKDIPIIVLSTKEEPTVKSEAFATGANDYLVKLPDKIELLARIRYHSKAYWNEVERDEAFRALRDSQQRLIEANMELQRLNNVDALTGASNRKHFDEYISTEWRRATREQTSLGVLMIDVDDFKSYNDTYGHLAGDEVLRKIAHTARNILGRPADLTARFGGEEFVIVLPGSALDGAQFVGENVRQGVADLQIPHTGSKVNGFVTISIGAASTVPRRSGTYASLIETADVALYQAKRNGKNCVVALGQDT
jgi:two-component system chemotaxis family response regulator WspR